MLYSDKVVLRQFNATDVFDLATLANNKKIWDNLRDYMPFPYTQKNAEDFIKFSLKEDPVLTFAIAYDKKFGGVIGIVPQPDVYRKSVELGYWIGETFWNRGIATKAVSLITNYAFELGFVRVFSGVFEYNGASMRVLEKNGFKHEGILEKALFKNDLLWDEHKYALVKVNI